MDDAALVRVQQRVAEGEADAQDVAVGQLLGVRELRERAPLDQLGDQVARAVLLAGVVDRDDPGVLQARGRDRLAARAHGRLRVGRDDLDRHPAVERLVDRLVHGAEAARAQAAAQPVAAQDQPGGLEPRP